MGVWGGMPLAGPAPDGYRNYSRGGVDGGHDGGDAYEGESTDSPLLEDRQPTLPINLQKAPSSPTPGQILKNNNNVFIWLCWVFCSCAGISRVSTSLGFSLQ